MIRGRGGQTGRQRIEHCFYRMRDDGLLEGPVNPADIQDRDRAPGLIERCRDAYPSLACFFADGGHAGPKLEAVIAHPDALTIKVVRRSDVRRFVILPLGK